MNRQRGAPVVLGIDAGSSSLRWRLRQPDGSVAAGRLGPLSGLSFLPEAPDHSEAAARVDALANAVRTNLGQVPLQSVYAGVTGLSAGDEAALALEDRLAASLNVPRARVTVVNDMRLAYRSAFAPGEGIVVYAGTGSIAVHLTRQGTLQRAGGHGYLIDDAGGGFWIGRQALRVVLRDADRRGGPATGPLADAVYAALGSRDWPAIRSHVYGGGRQRLSALVPAVRHAHAAGDREAEAIVAAAGRELARLADTLATRLGLRLPVALAGGAAGLGSPLRSALSAGLPPGSDVRIAERIPVDVAVALAEEAVDAA